MVKKVFLFVLLIILLISMTGCMSFFPKEDEMLILPLPSYTRVEYRTISPKKGDIINTVSILGIVVVDYINEKPQNFKANGYIDEIYVTNEQFVKEGELLAKLSEPEDREVIESNYTNSLNNYLNIQELYSDQKVSEYELRRSEINYTHAKEKYDELMDKMNSIELRASHSGQIVLMIDIKKGDPIGKTIQFCSIIEKQNKKITSTTSAANVAKLKVGNNVSLIFKDIQYQGFVIESAGTNVIFGSEEMNFANVGDVVQVIMILEESINVLKIPKNVVQMIDSNTGTIRVLKDNTPNVMTIKIGLSSATEYEVLPGQGIDENTKIITGTN